MSLTVVEQVAAELRRRGVTGTRVLVAVSGGCDSVALLRAVVEIRHELRLEVVVGHYNHRYRGADADADAAWVAELAARLEVPAVIGVAERAAASTIELVPEESARDERYAFLNSATRAHHCAAILMAHTADDQVETVLHHIFRGTGLAGLRGIPAERALSPAARLVRPLLGTLRSALENYLQTLGQDYRTDATNVDLQFTRNWLRHVALPMLKDRFPQLGDAVTQLAHQAADVGEFLTHQATALLEHARLDASVDGVRLRASALVDQPRPLVREMFVRLWQERGWPRQAMSFERWNELADLVGLAEVTRTFPGAIEVRRREDLLVLCQKPTKK